MCSLSLWERVRARGVLLQQLYMNHIQDRIQLFEHLIVPES